MKRRMHVISNTHWDREHRQGFQESRLMLADVLDRVIDMMKSEPDYAHFVMDGQAIPIEDYLDLKPQRRSQIEELVKAGRLHVGPWYTLADAFAVAPECLVRNLLCGHRYASVLGGVMKFGYSIFSFGQIAQLPQLYAGFGIEDVIFYKNPDRTAIPKSEFWWESPDGSRVLASRLGKDARWNFYQHFTVPVLIGGKMHSGREEWSSGFTAGARLCHMVDPRFKKYPSIELDRQFFIREELLRQGVEDAIQSCAPESHCENSLLFFDGCDFTTPLVESVEALRQANAVCADLGTLFFSTPMAYFAELREHLDLDTIQVYRGEMRAGPVDRVHCECMSANIEILRELGDAERCVLGLAGPLSVFASIAGAPYPEDALDLCWKYLLQAQTHDSVHALGSQKIKRDTRYRIEQVQEIAEVLARRAFEHVVSRIDTGSLADDDLMLTVFNPTAMSRTAVTELQIDFPEDDYVRDWWIETLEGERIESYPIEQTTTSVAMVTPEGRPKPVYVDRRCAEVAVPEIPGFGYRTFRIRRVKGTGKEMPHVFSSGENPFAPIGKSPRFLDNGLVQVKVNADGTIDLTDLETGERSTHLLEYVDSGCRGDVRVHHAPDHDQVISSVGAHTEIALVRNSGLRATVAITSTMYLPVSLAEDREARSEEKVPTAVKTEVTVMRGSKRVDIRTSFENRARDHLFRVRVPTGVATNTCWTDAPFEVRERAFAFSDNHGVRGPELARQTMCSLVDVTDGGQRGLALFVRANKEFGLECGDGTATIVLSLLRAVNGSYPMDPHVMIDVNDPFSQCLEDQTFEYALYTHCGDWRQAELPRRCAEYLHPPVAMEFGKGSNDGNLPLESASFVHLKTGALVFSGVKRSENGSAWIVRTYNPGDTPVEDAIVPFGRPSLVQEVRLDETPVRHLAIAEDGSVPLAVPPHRIVTVALCYEDQNS